MSFLGRFNADQKMKVIAKKTVGVRFSDWDKMTAVELEKIVIIPVIDEDIFSVDTAVINVIIGVQAKGRRTGHVMIINQKTLKDPKGLKDL